MAEGPKEKAGAPHSHEYLRISVASVFYCTENSGQKQVGPTICTKGTSYIVKAWTFIIIGSWVAV